MYQSPKLLRHGSFREMTQAGITGSTDHFTFHGVIINTPIFNPPPPPPEENNPITTFDVGSR